MAATKIIDRWRAALAGWISPRLKRDADRYHYLRGQIDRANRYFGCEFPEAGGATRWLLDEDTHHWAPIDGVKYWNAHKDLSAMRDEMRIFRNLKTSETTGLHMKVGQLYQVLFGILTGGPGYPDMIDKQRVLQYAGNIAYVDPDFLPWPRNAPQHPARDADWEWWWSRDEETYSGPHASRDEAIEDARDSGEEGSVHVMEARKGDIQLVSYFDRDGIESYIEHLEDGPLADYQGEAGEPLTEGISREQWEVLAARIQPIVAGWQRANGIVITPWSFAATRNGERVDLAATAPAKPEGGEA